MIASPFWGADLRCPQPTVQWKVATGKHSRDSTDEKASLSSLTKIRHFLWNGQIRQLFLACLRGFVLFREQSLHIFKTALHRTCWESSCLNPCTLTHLEESAPTSWSPVDVGMTATSVRILARAVTFGRGFSGCAACTVLTTCPRHVLKCSQTQVTCVALLDLAAFQCEHSFSLFGPFPTPCTKSTPAKQGKNHRSMRHQQDYS